MALSLARIAQNAGYDVLIGAPEDNSYIQKAKEKGFKTHIYQAPKGLLPTGKKLLKQHIFQKIWRIIADLLPYNLKTAQILKQQKIDLIYCAQERGVMQIGLGAKLSKTPVLWHIQSGLLPNAALIHTIAAKLSRHIFCVSNAVKQDLKLFLPQDTVDRAQIIYNGLADITDIKRKNHQNETIHILLAGNIVPERGAHNLIEAAMDLPRHNVKITLAGWLLDEEYHLYLQEMLSRYDMHNIELVGYREDIQDLIQNADIIVCPTVEKGTIGLNGRSRDIYFKEGFGLSALEAMRAGKPVICSSSQGFTEVVEHEVTGLHVMQDDVYSLGNALKRLIDNPAEREKMGAAGRLRYKKHFTDDKMATAFLRLLQDISATDITEIRTKKAA